MDKRISDRMQFYQFSYQDDLSRNWDYQRADMDSIQGLIIDISMDGVQILTDKSKPVDAGYYQVIVHADHIPGIKYMCAQLRHLWSKPDGGLYHRNGFAFDGWGDLASFIGNLLAAHEAGHRWLRCELAVQTSQPDSYPGNLILASDDLRPATERHVSKFVVTSQQ